MIIIIIVLKPEDLRSSFSISHSQHFAHNTTAERGLGGWAKENLWASSTSVLQKIPLLGEEESSGSSGVSRILLKILHGGE